MRPTPVRHNPKQHCFEMDTPASLAVADYPARGSVMRIASCSGDLAQAIVQGRRQATFQTTAR
jgi:hypothetical protein